MADRLNPLHMIHPLTIVYQPPLHARRSWSDNQRENSPSRMHNGIIISDARLWLPVATRFVVFFQHNRCRAMREFPFYGTHKCHRYAAVVPSWSSDTNRPVTNSLPHQSVLSKWQPFLSRFAPYADGSRQLKSISNRIFVTGCYIHPWVMPFRSKRSPS